MRQKIDDWNKEKNWNTKKKYKYAKNWVAKKVVNIKRLFVQKKKKKDKTFWRETEKL